MRTSRLEAFSDGVFAIAITLLVLEIRVPEDTHRLGHELLRLWPSYLAYGISFLLIGLVWANHHAMFDRIRASDRVLLFLNTLLLANVAALPFTTAVLARAISGGEGERTAAVVYGAWLVVGGIVFNAVWWWACTARLLTSDVSTAEARAYTRRYMVGPVAYSVGALLGLASWQAAIALFAVLIVFYWLPVTAGSGRRNARPAEVDASD